MIKYPVSIFFLFPVVTIGTTCDLNSIPEVTAAKRFVVNKETVTDTVSGLMWKKCREPLNGDDCSGWDRTFTKEKAEDRVSVVNSSSFAGYNDWRIPTQKELATIYDDKCFAPGINTAAFPNAKSESLWQFKSIETEKAWNVSYRNGSGEAEYSQGSHDLRLVRRGK